MLGSMRVMVVTSQKGGTGKTTLSGHIAVEAERNGFGPVALMDADPQGSLASWWNARVAETPHFARTEVSRLHTDIQRLRSSGVRLVIIDTPPAVTSTIRNVVAFADLVVIPTRPSPHDLRAVAATLDIVEYKGKPFVFVVNGATPRARHRGRGGCLVPARHRGAGHDPSPHRFRLEHDRRPHRHRVQPQG